MELRSSEESKKNIAAFGTRLLELMMNKKTIDNDIKALKTEFKEEGVPVMVVNSMINKIKSDMKKTDSELYEENTIKEWILADTKLSDKIGMLLD